MIFVDTNVIIDIFEEDPAWFTWSEAALARARTTGPVHTNHVVIAELAGQLSPVDALQDIGIVIADLDVAAALRAGAAIAEYRERGGKREWIITDFLIAGHAAARGWSLLTRDRKRLGTYFPDLTLITPDTIHG